MDVFALEESAIDQDAAVWQFQFMTRASDGMFPTMMNDTGDV